LLTFYGYRKCGTCRKALAWLDDRGRAVTFVDITEQPPPRRVLERALAGGEIALRQLFNTSGGEYRALNLKDRMADLSRAEALDLLTSRGKLVKRPVVTDGERVTVGFRADLFARVWGE
jgi:arsenate reductase